MTAMLLDAPGRPLRRAILPVPAPRGREILIRVGACAVCRTDLHIVDGELPPHLLPLVPGHEIVGRVAGAGPLAARFDMGQRVGVPWLGGSCGACGHCRGGRENLCEHAVFTGYDRHGGFADYTLADERYCLALPDAYDDLHAAPLLCAGLIGYRAYAMTGTAQRLGLYGFGAAAHLLAQLALRQGRKVYAFTRPGDTRAQDFARALGVGWAGDAGARPPEPLDAAILFAPAGELVPRALAAVRPGGVVVCAGIHMSDIPSFPYALLWGERCLRSVANLRRADGAAFFRKIAHGEVRTAVSSYPLEQANAALDALRAGRVEGAAVLVPAARDDDAAPAPP
ncbi:zinc-dependent alcohol dehydrogenase family protein [Massilia sp. G4R7]|uniref:Zinc-dependent alcohol dehydrogenase family protein n=1 Tax=Massilia phyllostachyos TaxID=2898585 RepID=A0ABS8Q372_9BURK|nr:zinc-dependent alcohol dehydrogenase family protein [Massilia phyllostachyos]MCD2516186.1 zinc-dependent alcohol dehydrogenase family protein [Massilia phyllostachyos]